MPASDYNLGGYESDDWQMLIYNFTNMQNSNAKVVESRDFNAAATIQFLTDLSPLFVILTTIISLLVIFLIDITHLSRVFFPQMGRLGYFVAFLIPAAILVARLGFGLLGAKDISSGAWISGVIGLVGTFAIAIFEHAALTHIAQVWGMPEQIGLFQFMVWLAVGAELRLMMTLGNENNLLNKLFGAKEKMTRPKKRKPRNRNRDEANLGNGQGNKGENSEEWEFNYNLQGNGT